MPSLLSAPYAEEGPVAELTARQPRAATDATTGLKRGIWVYFLLLILEGALRKWVLPSLATPLLIVRDPVALWLLLTAWRRGLLPANSYLSSMMLLGVVGIFTAVFLGHGSLFVAIYGARILMLHFPLIFVIGRVFNRDDVVRLGKGLLWLAIPMTVLMLLQFYSPQSAWVNRGVGGDTQGGGFSGANGYFRPPGTFSFITGLVQFYSLLAPFVLAFWLKREPVNRLLLLAATTSLLLAIPFSISRTLMFQTCLTVVFTVAATSRHPKYLVQMLLVGVGLVGVFLLLSNTSFFQTGTAAFTSRFETASQQSSGTVSGDLLARVIDDQLGPIDLNKQPFFGYGLGMGTNAGGMLLTGGQFFLISETEWGRVIGELGLLLGTSVILLRLALMVKIGLASYQKVVAGDLLPWLLLSFGFLIITQGQWAQPTTLGFSVLTGGLLVASLRTPSQPRTSMAPSASSGALHDMAAAV